MVLGHPVAQRGDLQEGRRTSGHDSQLSDCQYRRFRARKKREENADPVVNHGTPIERMSQESSILSR
jgi:hypothetical protein